MYSINLSYGCKPLTCDHLYGAKYGTEGILLHVVRPQWHPCPRSQQKVLAQDYWARWPRSCPRGQDLAQEARILPKRPNLAQDLAQDLRQDPGQDYGSQSWQLGQDLGQVLGKRGQVLGKISCPRPFCWELINCAPTMASFPCCAPTMAVHVVRPQWLSTLCAHNGCPRCAPTMAMHPCPRCVPTMAVHVVRPQWLSTLCAHNGCPRCAPTMAVHVVRPQWLSTLYLCAHNGCPRCAPTMAPLSTLCVAPLSCCAPA